REQREHVRQASVRPVLDELVDEHARPGIVELMEKPLTVPYEAAHSRFAIDDLEDALLVDSYLRIPVAHFGQRSCAVVADLEAQVVETDQQPVRGSLRPADRQHAGEAPPDDER